MSRFPWLPAVQRLCASALLLACQHRGEPPLVQSSAAPPVAEASAEPLSSQALEPSARQPSAASSAVVPLDAPPPAADVPAHAPTNILENARASGASPQADLIEPYPPARWRLADPARLDSVMLWFRQILIRHRDSPAGLVSHQLPHWRGAPPPPPRSREEAFALAQNIALEAHEHPERFAQLAQARSEDVATRHLGGAVGGTRASAVRVHVVLDVMAALQPGQVSRVVETGYGFHVFQRLPPPPERRLGGSRIVIAHDDAPWLSRFLARWPTPQRSKAQALELADDLHRQLRADPARFDELLQQWSDHQDAVRGGDFGEWSTREPSAFPRELEVLQRLQPGEVAAPMDSLFGIQIIQRTPPRERATYSYAALRLRFEPVAPPGSDLAEARVAERARAMADDVYAFPSAFQAYQRQLGGSGHSEQVEGRGDGPIDAVLAQLTPGQVARAPLRLRNEYLLLQRLVSTPPPLATSAPNPAERGA